MRRCALTGKPLPAGSTSRPDRVRVLNGKFSDVENAVEELSRIGMTAAKAKELRSRLWRSANLLNASVHAVTDEEIAKGGSVRRNGGR